MKGCSVNTNFVKLTSPSRNYVGAAPYQQCHFFASNAQAGKARPNGGALATSFSLSLRALFDRVSAVFQAAEARGKCGFTHFAHRATSYDARVLPDTLPTPIATLRHRTLPPVASLECPSSALECIDIWTPIPLVVVIVR